MVEGLCFPELLFFFLFKVCFFLQSQTDFKGSPTDARASQEDPRPKEADAHEESGSEPTGRSRYEERIAGWPARQVRTTSAFQCLPTNRQELVGAGFSGR